MRDTQTDEARGAGAAQGRPAGEVFKGRATNPVEGRGIDMIGIALTPAEVRMDWLLDSMSGRKPLRRAPQESAAAAPALAIDSDEALLALMQKIRRTYTPSTDPKRLAIADAIAQYLGVVNPAVHWSDAHAA